MHLVIEEETAKNDVKSLLGVLKKIDAKKI